MRPPNFRVRVQPASGSRQPHGELVFTSHVGQALSFGSNSKITSILSGDPVALHDPLENPLSPVTGVRQEPGRYLLISFALLPSGPHTYTAIVPPADMSCVAPTSAYGLRSMFMRLARVFTLWIVT